ncbi:unnamed protein product, partial [Closterium sp. NIES-53]
SSCEAEIYAGAMAAQELRWLTYLLTDLGEQPRSPPVLYVDNKAMLTLCREHRLEHRTKHIALRYFLARELQQRGQLRLAYVASEANTADIFTKALPPGDHQRFCTMLGLLALLCLTEQVDPLGSILWVGLPPPCFRCNYYCYLLRHTPRGVRQIFFPPCAPGRAAVFCPPCAPRRAAVLCPLCAPRRAAGFCPVSRRGALWRLRQARARLGPPERGSGVCTRPVVGPFLAAPALLAVPPCFYWRPTPPTPHSPELGFGGEGYGDDRSLLLLLLRLPVLQLPLRGGGRVGAGGVVLRGG